MFDPADLTLLEASRFDPFLPVATFINKLVLKIYATERKFLFDLNCEVTSFIVALKNIYSL